MKKILTLLFTLFAATSFAQEPFQNDDVSVVSWSQYRTNFGMEKVYVRFPYQPTATQTSTLLTAYCIKNDVRYTFVGYYPPIGNIDPYAFADRAIYNSTAYPNVLIDDPLKYRTCEGYYVLDFAVHERATDRIVRSRSVITPFNAYTLQVDYPNGAYNRADYFLDSLMIQCDCDH